MATVVLPVLRSPMISSRWPRPIGVMASMALMPVCSGSLTGWRPTMPGAWTSIRRVWSVAIGPLPSIGSPRALTTRPSRASPTGTERIRPVALTTCSSSSASTSPRTTAPMVSSSRLRASPRVPSSNSSSSFTAAPGRPETRAMPSPTSTMRPICSAPTSGVYSSTWRFSASVISSASMVSSAITQLPLGLFRALGGCSPTRATSPATCARAAPRCGRGRWRRPAGRRPAPPRRPGAQGSMGHLQLDRGPGQAGQRLGQVPALGLVDVEGGAHPGHPPAPGLGRLLDQVVEGADDVPGAPGGHHRVEEAQRGRGNLGRQQVVHDALAHDQRLVTVGQHGAQAGGGLDGAGEAEQLVFDLLERRRSPGPRTRPPRSPRPGCASRGGRAGARGRRCPRSPGGPGGPAR